MLDTSPQSCIFNRISSEGNYSTDFTKWSVLSNILLKKFQLKFLLSVPYIPAWYINKFTIIDFTIYTQLFLVKLKSVVDGPILHSKSVVDGSILHSKAKVCVFSVFMMVKLLIYHTGMCIKGPESWWIAKSITPQLVVNQSKINPQLPSVVVD